MSASDHPTAIFGPNSWLVEEMYDRYLEDPSSVGDTWKDFFADYKREGQTHPKAALVAVDPVAVDPVAVD
jgi:2-oxoglutarate decarboxylase